MKKDVKKLRVWKEETTLGGSELEWYGRETVNSYKGRG